MAAPPPDPAEADAVERTSASAAEDPPPPAADPYRYVDGSIRDVLAAKPPGCCYYYYDDDDDEAERGSSEAREERRRPPPLPLVDPSTLRVRWEALSRAEDVSRRPPAAQHSRRGRAAEMDGIEDGPGGVAGGADGRGGDGSASMRALVLLASEFERAIFDAPAGSGAGGGTTLAVRDSAAAMLSGPMLGALRLAAGADDRGGTAAEEEREARTLAATLLCSNLLESAIRTVAGKRTGRAPLLKDMIEIIARMAEDDGAASDGPGTEGVPRELAAVLRSLLLPTGLNLRNLLWHGFVASIPRKWLALTVGLTVSIERLGPRDVGRRLNSNDSAPSSDADDGHDDDDGLEGARALRRRDSLRPMLEHGRSILSSPDDMARLETLASASLIPPTHRALLRLALNGGGCEGETLALTSPVCFAALSCVLMEHGLRLLWCEANGRPDDAIARPGSYYVTLDGHGQRERHDTVLAPYMSPPAAADGGGTPNPSDLGERNALVPRLGGVASSFLADLFSSPAGPNVRSTVTHGMWDRCLLRELEAFAVATDDSPGRAPSSSSMLSAGSPSVQHDGVGDDAASALADVAAALLSALHLASERAAASTAGNDVEDEDDDDDAAAEFPFPPGAVRQYRPAFSYTACAAGDAADAVRALEELSALAETEEFVSSSSAANARQREISDRLSELGVPIRRLAEARRRIFVPYGPDDDDDGGGGGGPASSRRWTAEDVFVEQRLSADLAGCGAARALLSDVSAAAGTYVASIREGPADDDVGGEGWSGTAGEWRRRRHARLRSAAGITLHLYSFVAYVALLYIERTVPGEAGGAEGRPSLRGSEPMWLKAVERSRMCVSTFSLFTYSNLDRALKAAIEYRAGKAVRCIASDMMP